MDAFLDEDAFFGAGLDFFFFPLSSSSSSKSVSSPRECREEPELRDLMDLASSSESEGAMKSSSSEDAVEREPA